MKAAIALPLLLSGCATASNPVGWQSKHPDWHPPQGLEYAVAQCEREKNQVGGYDWVDAALRRGEAMAACMKAYGYE